MFSLIKINTIIVGRLFYFSLRTFSTRRLRQISKKRRTRFITEIVGRLKMLCVKVPRFAVPAGVAFAVAFVDFFPAECQLIVDVQIAKWWIVHWKELNSSRPSPRNHKISLHSSWRFFRFVPSLPVPLKWKGKAESVEVRKYCYKKVKVGKLHPEAHTHSLLTDRTSARRSVPKMGICPCRDSSKADTDLGSCRGSDNSAANVSGFPHSPIHTGGRTSRDDICPTKCSRAHTGGPHASHGSHGECRRTL